MLEVIAGGAVGALLALLGNYLVVRDTRRGRETASEERAAATLLTQLRRVRADPRFLLNVPEQQVFTEECLTAVLAFRDRQVRQRLTASIDMITNARAVANQHGQGWMDEQVYNLAFADIRACLEARLDRARLPKPDSDWRVAQRSLYAYVGNLVEELNAAEEAADQEREEFLDRMVSWELQERVRPRRDEEPGR